MDWTHAAVGVVSLLLGGTGIVGILEVWRKRRMDEVAVLQRSIDELRKDRDADRVELHAVKDDYTACLVKSERAGAELVHLRGEVKRLRRELRALKGEAGGDDDEPDLGG